MPHHPIIVSDYLNDCFTHRRLNHIVRRLVKALKPHSKHFDSIACRGASGMLVAPMVASRLRKNLILVRKGEYSHSSRDVEGDLGTQSYVIVDDVVSSGTTVRHIIEDIAEQSSSHRIRIVPPPACYAVALYLDRDGERPCSDSWGNQWQCRPLIIGTKETSTRDHLY